MGTVNPAPVLSPDGRQSSDVPPSLPGSKMVRRGATYPDGPGNGDTASRVRAGHTALNRRGTSDSPAAGATPGRAPDTRIPPAGVMGGAKQ